MINPRNYSNQRHFNCRLLQLVNIYEQRHRLPVGGGDGAGGRDWPPASLLLNARIFFFFFTLPLHLIKDVISVGRTSGFFWSHNK